MKHGKAHPRGLNLCSSSIDARLEDPVPLRIQKGHDREGSDVPSRQCSRHASSGSMGQFLSGAGPLTIMKRRRRHDRPSILTSRSASRHGYDFHQVSSSHAQLSNAFGGSEWPPLSEAVGRGAKSQSLAVRKVRKRQSSIAAALKEIFRNDRGPSAPTCLRRWQDELSMLPTPEPDTYSCSSGLTCPVTECASMDIMKAYYVLSPCVMVTTDISALNEGHNTIWAAIEVAGRLSRIPAGGREHSETATGTFVEHKLDRYFEFGCLYDLNVRVLPANGSVVIQVLKEQDFPTILILAEIRVEQPAGSSSRKAGHVRQTSEELMEDLEFQLGDIHADYMQIEVSFSHSAFPEHAGLHQLGGVSSIQSTMKTVAVATLKRRNDLSPWSLRPAPAQNTLFRLIAQHWGDEKATEAMQKMLSHRSTPRKPAEGGNHISKESTIDVRDYLNGAPDQISRPDIRSQKYYMGQQVDGNWEPCGPAPPDPGYSDAGSSTSTTSVHRSPSMAGDEKHLLGTICDSSPSGLHNTSYDSGMYVGGPIESSSSRRRTFGIGPLRHFLASSTVNDGECSTESNHAGLEGAELSKREGSSRWGWASWF